jgi:hypothetical protein
VNAALERARGDPVRQVRLLGGFLHDKSLSVGELCRAGNYLFDLLCRLEREAGKQRRPRQRAGFRVVSTTAEEQAAKLAKRDGRT